jgi:outer membrane protein assembly factor BamE
MKKMLTLALIGFILSGCSLFRTHKLDIEQGNIITQENVSRLHLGMTQDQVKGVMGNPVLVNIFTPNRIDFIYSFQPGYGRLTVQRITCIFQQGRLREILKG